MYKTSYKASGTTLSKKHFVVNGRMWWLGYNEYSDGVDGYLINPCDHEWKEDHEPIPQQEGKKSCPVCDGSFASGGIPTDEHFMTTVTVLPNIDRTAEARIEQWLVRNGVNPYTAHLDANEVMIKVSEYTPEPRLTTYSEIVSPNPNLFEFEWITLKANGDVFDTYNVFVRVNPDKTISPSILDIAKNVEGNGNTEFTFCDTDRGGIAVTSQGFSHERNELNPKGAAFANHAERRTAWSELQAFLLRPEQPWWVA